MSISTLHKIKETDSITRARVDLAAAHRLSVLHDLEEGIDNHFTVTLPDYDD